MAAAYSSPSCDLDEHFRQLYLDKSPFDASQSHPNTIIPPDNRGAEHGDGSQSHNRSLSLNKSPRSEAVSWNDFSQGPTHTSANTKQQRSTLDDEQHYQSPNLQRRHEVDGRSAPDFFSSPTSLEGMPNIRVDSLGRGQQDSQWYNASYSGEAALTLASLYAQSKGSDRSLRQERGAFSFAATTPGLSQLPQQASRAVPLFNADPRSANHRGPELSTSLLFGGAQPYTPAANLVSGATNINTTGRNTSRTPSNRRMGSNLSNWGMAGGPTPGLEELHRQFNAQQRTVQQNASDGRPGLQPSTLIRFASPSENEKEAYPSGVPTTNVATSSSIAGGLHGLPPASSGHLPSAFELASLGVGIGPGVNPSLGTNETSASERPPIINTGNAGPMCVQPGDWVCSSCGFVNWRRRRICMRCYPFAENSEVSASLADGAILAAQIAAGHNPGQETIAALARPANRRDRSRSGPQEKSPEVSAMPPLSPHAGQQQKHSSHSVQSLDQHLFTGIRTFDRPINEGGHISQPSGFEGYGMASSTRSYGPIDMPVSPFFRPISALPLGGVTEQQLSKPSYAHEASAMLPPHLPPTHERHGSGSIQGRLLSSPTGLSPPSSGKSVDDPVGHALSSPWSPTERSFDFKATSSSSPPSQTPFTRSSISSVGSTRDIWGSTGHHIPWNLPDQQAKTSGTSRRTLSASSGSFPGGPEQTLSPRKSHAIPIRRPAPIGTRPSTGTSIGRTCADEGASGDMAVPPASKQSPQVLTSPLTMTLKTLSPDPSLNASPAVSDGCSSVSTVRPVAASPSPPGKRQSAESDRDVGTDNTS